MHFINVVGSDERKSCLSMCALMENPCHIALWQLQSHTHTHTQTVILCHSVPFITCTRLFPLPPSDIMGQSKVTHIYPIKRGFEKTHIELRLMLQWGPESERCYRPKRLGFQVPANKRQSSPQREREKEGMGVMMGEVGRGDCECTLWNSSVRGAWSVCFGVYYVRCISFHDWRQFALKCAAAHF